MGNGEASSIIELPFYSKGDIARLDQDSGAPYLAHNYNRTITQLISNAEEYRTLIEEANKRGWDTETIRKMIYGTNRLLDSTHTLFNTERDFGKRK